MKQPKSFAELLGMMQDTPTARPTPLPEGVEYDVVKITREQLRLMSPTTADHRRNAAYSVWMDGYPAWIAFYVAGMVCERVYDVSAVVFDLGAAAEVGPF